MKDVNESSNNILSVNAPYKNPNNDKERTQKSTLTLSIPRFLLRMGSTYFRKFKPEEIEKIKKGKQNAKIPKRDPSKKSKTKVNPRTTAAVKIINSNIEEEKVEFEEFKLKKEETKQIVKEDKKEDLRNEFLSKFQSRESIKFIQTEELFNTVTNNDLLKDAITQGESNDVSKMISKTERPSSHRAVVFNQDKMEVSGNLEACTSRRLNNQPCLICFDKDPDAVFMECGHGGVCYDCAIEVWKNNGICTLCREPLLFLLQIDQKSLQDNMMKVLSYTYIRKKKESSISNVTSEIQETFPNIN